jgi:hypothetical protein
MPRLPRLDAPGVLHQVMGRGIERSNIFLNTTDRNDFIARLEHLADEGSMAVYAWALSRIKAISVKSYMLQWEGGDGFRLQLNGNSKLRNIGRHS